MILCKTIYTLFGPPSALPHRCLSIPTPDGGGLRLLSGGGGDSPSRTTPNVLESSAIGPAPARTDPGSWGLHEAEDGLGLCTESLGSESCDVSSHDVAGIQGVDEEKIKEGWGMSRSRSQQRGRNLIFPPPLPWMDGRRIRFIRAVRTDGRILLTEVQIERPEIFRASREDGRLKLQLVETAGISPPVEGRHEEEEPPQPLTPPPVMRCQEVGGGGGEGPMWWSGNKQCVTTA